MRRHSKTRPSSRAFVWMLAALFLAAGPMSSGCGRPATRLQGVVTIDGQPVDKAIVQFSPERRDGPTAVAITDAAGRYSLAVSAVPFRVTIVAQRVVGQKKDDANPDGGLVDVHEDVVPARYGDLAKTPLRAEPVADTVTTLDFPLTAGR